MNDAPGALPPPHDALAVGRGKTAGGELLNPRKTAAPSACPTKDADGANQPKGYLMIVTLIVLAIWTLLAVVFGVIIGAGVRLADDRAPHAEAPEYEAAA